MSATDIEAPRQWIARLQDHLHDLELNPRDEANMKIAEEIRREIARVEELMGHSSSTADREELA